MKISESAAVEKILGSLQIPLDAEIGTRNKLTYYELFWAILLAKSLQEVPDILSLSIDTIEKTMSRYVYKRFTDKPKLVKWDSYLLGIIEYKKCRECQNILHFSEYSKSKDVWDGLSYVCKACRSIRREIFTLNNPEYSKQHYLDNKSEYISRAIQYKTRRSLATPPWADKQKIKDIYDNCPEGYHVDHIIPLQGELVSGLHIETNLQYLKATENLIKSNKYIID